MPNNPPTTEERRRLNPVVRRFRILQEGDVICEGDEYLEEDAKTWSPLPAMWLGTRYNLRVMAPCRGAAPNAKLSDSGTAAGGN